MKFAFTGNNSGIRIAILIIIAFFILGGLGWCRSGVAQEVEASTSVSFGLPFIGGELCDFSAMVIAREFSGRSWLGGITTHGEGECKGEFVAANFGAFVLHQTWVNKHLSVGFGAALFEHGDIGVGKAEILNQPESTNYPRKSDTLQMTGVIMIRTYWLEDSQLVIDLPLHFSNGSSSRFNPGWNLLMVGYRFGD